MGHGTKIKQLRLGNNSKERQGEKNLPESKKHRQLFQYPIIRYNQLIYKKGKMTAMMQGRNSVLPQCDMACLLTPMGSLAFLRVDGEE